jgi:hypothetical protein
MPRVWALLTAVGLATLPAACAPAGDDPGRPEVFVDRLAEAIRSRSLERRKALVHPRSLACIAATGTEAFFDEALSRQLRYTIPPGKPEAQLSRIPPEPLPFTAQFDYPLRPTREVRLSFEDGKNTSGTLFAYIAHDAGRWAELLPCPKPETVARMRAAQEEKARRDRRAEELAAALPGPARADLVSLVKGGRRVEAIRQYASTSGEDLAMAKRVVELVAPEER